MTPRILVLGGSGFVGRALLEVLQREGLFATVPTRRASSRRELGPLPGVQAVQGDVLNEAGLLERLLPGHDAVVNLIAVLHGSEARFEQLHVQWPHRLARACVAAGVPRLLHVSALGVGHHAQDGASALPSRYLRSKARGELTLQTVAPTVLRPSVIFGARDRFLNLFASLQALAPCMPLAGADARFQPVWVGDVATALLRCLQWPETAGQTYELGGPEVFTLRELVQLAGTLSGHLRPILPLPAPLAHLQALALECLPGEPLMSRDNLASMRVPNVLSGELPGLRELGIAATPLRPVAAGYLGGGVEAQLDGLRARH
ncbi:MAG: complex I NDUFA9 subunit family protein [Burkholderiales bacterium]|nr:complex I NDUFA9 subunit family protein [Burkholderiales bacterium]